MKRVVRLLLGIAGLFAVALVALAIALPRIAKRAEVRDAIARAALDATGRELRFGELDAGVLPPRLIVESPELVARKGDAPLRADRVALRLALLPLFVGKVGVDTLTLDGADLTFARTPDGFELPVEIAAAEEAAPQTESAVELAVREIRVTNSRVALEDRIAVPTTTWALEGVDARASGSLLTGRVTFAVEATLASGGEPRFALDALPKFGKPRRLTLAGDLLVRADGDELEVIERIPMEAYLASVVAWVRMPLRCTPSSSTRLNSSPAKLPALLRP